MKILDMISYAKKYAMHGLYFYRKQVDSRYEKDRLLGEILRNTHSIEKGLALANVRLGFGVKKIEEAKALIEKFLNLGGNANSIPLKMFVSALSAYLDYHSERGFSNEDIEKVNSVYNELSKSILADDRKYGGIVSVKKQVFSNEELNVIAELFNNRHSVREFNGTTVDSSKLKAAILLAMRCPSACNRQCYRVHIVNKSSFSRLRNWMDGIGGFADDIDKLLIITGNISVYRLGESYQHVVTASVFASYLTLSLQAYGIGCCFVQRDVVPSKRWKTLGYELNIPSNEEVVCCLGIGNLKEEYKVPVSYRLPYELIVSEIK